MTSNLGSNLKNNKLSFTQQRRVILEEIQKADDHITADNIYMLVKKRMLKVSIGTIYRNLNVLVELGYVDKVETSLHSESHYEVHKDTHYHIVCKECLRIDDLEHYRALSIEPTAAKISGYQITNHSVELLGLCPACQKKLSSLPLMSQANAVNAVNTVNTLIPNKDVNQVFENNELNKQQKTRSYNKRGNRKFFFGRNTNP